MHLALIGLYFVRNIQEMTINDAKQMATNDHAVIKAIFQPLRQPKPGHWGAFA